MNNDELKNKMVKVLRELRAYKPIVTNDYGLQIISCTTDREIADALIAAGFGDVKEAEAEANRYEMLYKMQSRDMALLERKVHEAEHRAKVLGRTLAIMKGKGLISGVVDDYIVQAEKELAEESKDD